MAIPSPLRRKAFPGRTLHQTAGAPRCCSRTGNGESGPWMGAVFIQFQGWIRITTLPVGFRTEYRYMRPPAGARRLPRFIASTPRLAKRTYGKLSEERLARGSHRRARLIFPAMGKRMHTSTFGRSLKRTL